jgi:hypothetical protein
MIDGIASVRLSLPSGIFFHAVVSRRTPLVSRGPVVTFILIFHESPAIHQTTLRKLPHHPPAGRRPRHLQKPPPQAKTGLISRPVPQIPLSVRFFYGPTPWC